MCVLDFPVGANCRLIMFEIPLLVKVRCHQMDRQSVACFGCTAENGFMGLSEHPVASVAIFRGEVGLKRKAAGKSPEAPKLSTTCLGF